MSYGGQGGGGWDDRQYDRMGGRKRGAPEVDSPMYGNPLPQTAVAPSSRVRANASSIVLTGFCVRRESRKSSRTRPPLAPGRFGSRSQEEEWPAEGDYGGRNPRVAALPKRTLTSLEIPQSRMSRQVDQTAMFDGGEEEEDDGDDKNRERGCRCGRTKCLKQYCQCFRNDIRCCPECVCVDCHNDGKHEAKRIDAIRHIRMNNPVLPSSACFSSTIPGTDTADGASREHSRERPWS